MTQIAIDTQVKAIKKATTEALKSKKAALQFLIDAGIVKQPPAIKKQDQSTKK